MKGRFVCLKVYEDDAHERNTPKIAREFEGKIFISDDMEQHYNNPHKYMGVAFFEDATLNGDMGFRSFFSINIGRIGDK